MELENEKRRNSIAEAEESLSNFNNISLSTITDMTADNDIAQSANSSRAASPEPMHPTATEAELPTKAENKPTEESTADAAEQNGPDESSKSLTENVEASSITDAAAPIESKEVASTGAQASDKAEKEKEQEDKSEAPKVESFAAAMISANTADVGSRFYIKRRIIVGNVSKYMAPGIDHYSNFV
jgi:hypothetical protein